MPAAYDLQRLTITHNPTEKVDTSFGKLPDLFSPEQILEQVKDFIQKLLFPAIEELTGIDLSAFLPTIEAVFDALTTLFGDLNPLSGTFNPLDAVTTFIELMVTVGANLPMALIQELTGFSGGIPILSQLVQALTGQGGGLDDLFNFNVLGGDSPLNALNIFGIIPQGLFGLIPAGSIGATNPNLLSNPGFDGAISMVPGGGWVWDSATGRTTPGAAKATASGALLALYSNAVPVTQGQKLDVSVWVKTASYIGSGTPIRLGLRTFNGTAVVNTVTVASMGPAPSFAQLSGSYTVPAGVDSIRLRLIVDTTATAGSVWFDDAELRKAGNGPFDGILDLFGLSALDDLFNVDVTSIWSTIINLILNPLGLLKDLTARLNVQDIIDNIFGGFTNLGQLGDTNNPVSTVLSSIFGIFDTGLTANNRTSQLDARIKALESSANTIVEDFSGASASSLGLGWTQTYSGGGAGSLGLDGKGNAVWKPSGASNRFCLARYSASALTTDNGVIQAVLSTSPQSYAFDDAYTYLCARMNTSNTYVRCRIGFDSVRVQAVVAGVVTNIGSSWSGKPKAGDTFEFRFGEAAGANKGHYVVKRNDVTIIDFTDTAPVSVWGASNRSVGVAVETGNRLVLFQNIPAGLGVFTAAEVV